MATTTRITFFDPQFTPDAQPEPRDDLSAIPSVIENAGYVLNASILVGEMLEVEVDELLEIINEVTGPREGLEWADAVPRVFTDDDLPVLASCLRPVVDRLQQALDINGRSNGPWGERLAASASVEVWDGRLALKYRRVPVIEVLASLRCLVQMVAHAAKNELWLQYVVT